MHFDNMMASLGQDGMNKSSIEPAESHPHPRQYDETLTVHKPLLKIRLICTDPDATDSSSDEEEEEEEEMSRRRGSFPLKRIVREIYIPADESNSDCFNSSSEATISPLSPYNVYDASSTEPCLRFSQAFPWSGSLKNADTSKQEVIEKKVAGKGNGKEKKHRFDGYGDGDGRVSSKTKKSRSNGPIPKEISSNGITVKSEGSTYDFEVKSEGSPNGFAVESVRPSNGFAEKKEGSSNGLTMKRGGVSSEGFMVRRKVSSDGSNMKKHQHQRSPSHCRVESPSSVFEISALVEDPSDPLLASNGSVSWGACSSRSFEEEASQDDYYYYYDACRGSSFEDDEFGSSKTKLNKMNAENVSDLDRIEDKLCCSRMFRLIDTDMPLGLGTFGLLDWDLDEFPMFHDDDGENIGNGFNFDLDMEDLAWVSVPHGFRV